LNSKIEKEIKDLIEKIVYPVKACH